MGKPAERNFANIKWLQGSLPAAAGADAEAAANEDEDEFGAKVLFCLLTMRESVRCQADVFAWKGQFKEMKKCTMSKIINFFRTFDPR